MTDQASGMVSVLRRVFARDLAAMRREVTAYPDDATLWRPLPGLPNPGGTLALHCAGNLRHFVGAALGGTGYRRDREAEFTSRGIMREVILGELDAAASEVDATLADLDPSRLARPFPVALGSASLDTGTALVHLAVHLAYHLGQLDAHRRAVSGDVRPIGAMDPGALTGSGV